MEALGVASRASAALHSPSPVSNIGGNPSCSRKLFVLQALPWKTSPLKIVEARMWSTLCVRRKSKDIFGKFSPVYPQPRFGLDKSISLWCGLLLKSYGCRDRLRKYACSLRRVTSRSEKVKHHVSVLFGRLAVGVMLAMSVSAAVSSTPSWAFSEENLLFLEAWRTIDRAYVDKSFNGQSWFRYRENALRNEPMNTREETYMAIRKMLATLDDPFTRFLEPEKFKTLRSGTQGALTGVGLSIGYPAGFDESSTGLVVISAAPGGPANRAGIVSGDVILSIDESRTDTMDLYDAAERLKGPEGSLVKLTIRSGLDIKHLSLTREKVSLNPVKSRLCIMPGVGKDAPRIGYIKLASFSQNASGAVKEAVETLRSNDVRAFVLDLRDNSGGLFPEGIEIAKIWLDKGIIVYICDSRGVRDIYDADGSDAIVASEPLAVLVLFSVFMMIPYVKDRVIFDRSSIRGISDSIVLFRISYFQGEHAPFSYVGTQPGFL